MLKKLRRAISKLKKDESFKGFKKDNPDAYLSSCVVITDGKNAGDWEMDYYQPKKHKITTFVLNKSVQRKGEDDVFQKEKSDVEELKLNEVKVGFDKMMGIVEDYRKKHYAGDYPAKIIVVLQRFNGRVIWNVTHLTSTLKIWNIKLDANDGKVIEERIENVFSLKAK